MEVAACRWISGEGRVHMELDFQDECWPRKVLRLASEMRFARGIADSLCCFPYASSGSRLSFERPALNRVPTISSPCASDSGTWGRDKD